MSDIVTKIDLADKNGVLLHTEKKYCRRNLLVIPRLNPLEISENGTYPVPNGFAGNGAVVVNVVPKKETALVITANGTYVAPAGTVYTSIVVNVPTSSGGTPEGGEGETPHVHKYTSEVIEPSCMQGGYTLYTCECGHSYKSDEKAPLDHDYIDGTCSRCGAADPTYTPDVSEPAKGSYSVNVGDTFRISYEGNSPDVECPGCLTFYIDSNELIFTAVSAGSGTIYIRISDTLIGQYDVKVTAVARYDYNLKVGETFSISYEGSSPTVECPSCLTYYIDGGELVFTAANVGSGTLRLYDSDTLIAEYTIQVAAQESGGDAHIHSYTTEVTNPTCTAAGYTTHTCQCGHSFMDTHVDALGHSYVESVVIDNTCTEPAIQKYACFRCNAEKPFEESDIVRPALGHNWGNPYYSNSFESGYGHKCDRCGELEALEYVECTHPESVYHESVIINPTCTEKGSKTCSCDVCRQSWTEEIEALGHSYVASVVTDNTCTEPAIQKYACFRCNAEKPFEEKDIVRPPLGHAWGNPIYDVIGAYEPTCAVPGYAVYVCSVCKAEKWETVPATGKHSWGDDITYNGDGYYTPTCTDPGFGAYVCASCGGEKETIVPALGHNYGSEVIDPTCEDYGYTLYTCGTCGDTYTSDSTEPTGHNWGIGGGWWVNIAATCTDKGEEERACLNCTKHETREIPATGHKQDTSGYKAPTCTETGLTNKITCSVCDEVLVEQETIAALGHKYTSVTTAPTCTEKGYTKHTCSVCGHSYTSGEKAALGHTEETVKGYAATCTESGLTDGKKCSVCGVTTVAQSIIPAKGHTEETVKGSAATCTAAGKTDGKKCSVCGKVTVEQKTIPALGHSYSSKVTPATCTEGGYTTHTCTVCGHSYTDSETEPNGHNFASGWVVTTYPTCTAKGEETSTCMTCGHKETRSVSALGHDYKAVEDSSQSSGYYGVCDRCGDVIEDYTP